MAYLTGLSQRAVQAGYRGCGLTNAAVEYPEDPHPARAVAVEHKVELRRRLADMARGMGATDRRRWATACCCCSKGRSYPASCSTRADPPGNWPRPPDG